MGCLREFCGLERTEPEITTLFVGQIVSPVDELLSSRCGRKCFTGPIDVRRKILIYAKDQRDLFWDLAFADCIVVGCDILVIWA